MNSSPGRARIVGVASVNGEVVIPPSSAEELPRVTVELVMQEKLVKAYLRSVPRKQGRRFLRCLFEEPALDDHDNVVPIKHREVIEARRKKERGAVAWARSRLPAWMLPPA